MFKHFNTVLFPSRQLNQNTYVPREAGSQKDENLAYFIENQFHEFKLSKVWRDEHYVKIQVKGRYVERWQTLFYRSSYLQIY
jgi:transferrin receptor